jgi:hypothetical protein
MIFTKKYKDLHLVALKEIEVKSGDLVQGTHNILYL